MAEKRQNYTEEFKREAIRLVTEQGYGVAETARNRFCRKFSFEAICAMVSPSDL
jgi:hypothetical protein